MAGYLATRIRVFGDRRRNADAWEDLGGVGCGSCALALSRLTMRYEEPACAA